MDWNAYRAVLAEEAGKLIGQPVAVRGAVDVTLLPKPTVILNDVTIGGRASVERFEARLEPIPLLGGTFRVADVALVRPRIDIDIDEAGAVDWRLGDGPALYGLDPDAVVVDHVTVRDGEVTVSDARTGATFAFQSITTDQMQAPSLLGPWKLSGRLRTAGDWVEFRIATGRREANGNIRTVIDLLPSAPHLAGTLTMDGTIKSGASDLYYEGEFAYRKYRLDGAETPVGIDAAWRMAGTFRLDPRQLRVPSFSVNEGSGNTPFGITGAMSVNFGSSGQFAAEITSQQIDLDRPQGEGARADVPAALSRLLSEVSSLPVPPIGGRVGVSIPAIVVGGGVVQGLSFDAIPAEGAWQIRDMSVRLPGRSAITANGTVVSGASPSFFGYVQVSSEQPAALTAWLGGEAGPRLRVSDLDVSARIHVERGAFDAQNIEAKLGGADARGWVFWEGKGGVPPRLRAELKADRVQLDDLKTLATYFYSGIGGTTGDLAENVELTFAAKRIDTGGVPVNDVAVAGSLAGDTLNVGEFRIGDIAGASLVVDGGRIASLSTGPRGRIAGRFEAESMSGVLNVAERLWPNAAVTRWLRQAGPTLAPVATFATITAGAAEAGDMAFDLTGSVGGSSLAATARVVGSPFAWRTVPAELSVLLENRAAAELARQFALPALPIGATLPGRLELKASGVAAEGMQATVAADLAGTRLDMEGTVASDGEASTLDASFRLESADIDPLLLIAGQTLPGIGLGTPASVSGSVEADAGGVFLILRDASRIDGRPVSGNVDLARAEGGWRLGGRLKLETIDVAWLASLGLGVAPELTGEAERPWSTLPFGEPATAGLRGAMDLDVARLAIGPGLSVADARLAVGFEPAVLDLKLSRGTLAGGTATGSLSLRNPVGDTAASGQIVLANVALGPLLWQGPGGPAVDGRFSLSAEFEATGKATADLVGSLTGGGTVTVEEGMVRGIDPGLFAAIVEAGDKGRSFTGDEIAARFAGAPAGSAIAFERASGRLALAAGTARIRDITVEGAAAVVTGAAEIDLGRLTMDGDFTVMPASPGPSNGTRPEIAVGVSGPLADPQTTIDGAPLARYLAERTLRRLELLQDEELERDRLQRLLRKQQEEREARLEAERQAAAEAARIQREAQDAEAASRRNPAGIFSAPLPPPDGTSGPTVSPN